jgi:two-component system cell cycle sensor histidine kinase/response regulator CckA
VAADEQQQIVPPERKRREGTVMLVEDEQTVRDMTSRLLTRAGYMVVPLSDALSALEYLEGGRRDVDVLVTDVVMPGMSGLALAEKMMERYPSMGLVLISGYLAESLDLRAIAARGARFMSKPVASHEFLAAVDEALAQGTRRSVD